MVMLKTIVLWIVEWAVSKASTFLVKYFRLKKADEEIDQRTQGQADALKNAKTDEEFDSAAKDLANGR